MVMERMRGEVLSLPRTAKRFIALGLDAGLCVLTVWLAYFLRLNEWVSLSDGGWVAALVSLVCALPIFVLSGLYRAVFRYVGWDALLSVVLAIGVYGVLYSAIFTAFGVDGVPRTIGIIQPVLLLIAIGATRIVGRYWLSGTYREHLRRNGKKPVLIYGAGSAGRKLAAAIAESPDMRVVGFVDDDRSIQRSVIGGIRVYSAEEVPEIAARTEVSEILLAIPSASRQRRNEILRQIAANGMAVRTLPDLLDIAHGKVTMSDLRPLDLDDLLGREPVRPDERLLRQNILGKTILVSGAGGSIGSELSRQILGQRPLRMLLVESSEYALYAIHHELETIVVAENLGVELVPLLASVCDAQSMRHIFSTWQPDTVYHAAAFKHVPLVEYNVAAGVRNNVYGTWICANLAQEYGAAHFVLISTDKAVRPTNVMGASKRLAELVLQALANEDTCTCFCMVRFGNVLGSSGSVVPLFRRQISAGGPVTVTHPGITRYFMSIPEAAQLVLQAAAMSTGGEVFVLDMGEPVKIVDLATRMIELSGLSVRTEAQPGGEIDIVYTGLRPGEKLYEELLIGGNPTPTSHPRIMKAQEPLISLGELRLHLRDLQSAVEAHNVPLMCEILSRLVQDYVAPAELSDTIWTERDSKLPKSKLAAMSQQERSTSTRLMSFDTAKGS